MKNVGKTIRALRERRGLTQEQLAERLYITRQTLSNYENGRTRPDFEMLEQLAAALDTEPETLLWGPPDAGQQRRAVRRTLLAAGCTLAALLLSVLLGMLDPSAVSYDPAAGTLRFWVARPLVCLLLGWTLVQAASLLTRTRPLPERLARPARRVLLALLAGYLLFLLPYLLWALWSAVQLRLHGALTAGFALPPALGRLAMPILLLVRRAPAVFALLGGGLRLCGFPRGLRGE